MLTATVVGNVWSTRRLAEIPNGAFLEVEAEGTGTRLVAFDVLGSGVGERVLVAQGSVAAAWFPGKAAAGSRSASTSRTSARMASVSAPGWPVMPGSAAYPRQPRRPGARPLRTRTGTPARWRRSSGSRPP